MFKPLGIPKKNSFKNSRSWLWEILQKPLKNLKNLLKSILPENYPLKLMPKALRGPEKYPLKIQNLNFESS